MADFEVERRSVMMSFTNDLVATATLFALDALCLLLATNMRLDSFSASWTYCKLPKMPKKFINFEGHQKIKFSAKN